MGQAFLLALVVSVVAVVLSMWGVLKLVGLL